MALHPARGRGTVDLQTQPLIIAQGEKRGGLRTVQPVKAADGQPSRRQHSLFAQGKDAFKAPRYAEINLQMIALITQLLKTMRLQAYQQRVHAVKQGITRNAAAAVLTGQGGKGFSAKTV